MRLIHAFRPRARLAVVLVLLLAAVVGWAQAPKVQWSAKLVPADARAGESAQVVLTAKIEKEWHIYALRQEGGPVATAFEVKGDSLLANGEAVQPDPQTKFDENFGVNVGLHEGEVAFALPVQIAPMATGEQHVVILATSQACNANTCDFPAKVEVPLSLTVQPGQARPDRAAPVTTVPVQPAGYVAPKAEPPTTAKDKPNDAFAGQLDTARSQGLFAYLWLSFGFGLLALLTPCVFPMIPVTVSYFSKAQENGQKRGVGGAVAYCLGIVGTFTALGLGVTLLFGASGIQRLATNPWVNLGLALLFVVLAANLFGVFEIQMPSWLVNRASQGRTKRGWVGPMMMGLAFTLTSFTCTVPFVGTLLVGAAQGDVLYPALGMLAFSTAFALPFFLLALFPGYLANLPKSGSWLASVKVFMGFLELAAALKFLSNVDLVWRLGWITQPVFLAVWAGIGAVASLYLFGWILLPHETPGKIGWPRRLVGVAMVVATGFCLAGLQGRSLGELSAFLPPDPYPGHKATGAAAQIGWVHSYDEALAKAKAESKPMLINFTGVTCTNCRWMEKNMFPRGAVVKELERYVPVELYTDRGTPEDLANRELEQKLTGVITLPVYVIVSPEGKALEVFQGSTRDEAAFVAFLKTDTRVAAK